MKIEVESRVNRILKYIDKYFNYSENKNLINEIITSLSLADNEKIIGFYQNNIDIYDELIIITNLGLHLIIDKKDNTILYNKIKETITPPEKTNVKGLHILLIDGEKIWLPINGVVRNKLYDAFEFIRFIDRVVGDLKR
jgi:hypothetical protein